MKKSFFIISIVIIIAVLCAIYAVDHIRMSNNQSVVFSTWGKSYAPPEGIDQETAIEIARNVLDDKSKEAIINLDNPKVEEVVFDTEHHMAYFDDKVKPSDKPLYKITGKPLYKITFNTIHDGLLGPIVIYVDKSDGKPIGMDFRM